MVSFLLSVTETDTKSILRLQMLPKSCDINSLSLCSKHSHLSLSTNAKDLDLTRIWSALSLTLNHFLSVSWLESSIRLDSSVKMEAVVPGGLMKLLKASTETEGSGFEVVRRRSKRSVFLHSGVRICPQETIEQVLASHQAYYQLRGTLFN